jgi:DNA modification methylase
VNLFIHGDAFKLIKDVPNSSVDLILTDPPYDATIHIRTGRLTNEQKLAMAKQFFRVLKSTGNLVIFCGFTDKFDWYNVLRNFFKFKSEILIVYGMGRYSRIFIKNFAPAYEAALYFVKSDKYYWKERAIESTVFTVKRNEGFSVDYIGIPDPKKLKLNVTPKPLSVVKRLVEILCPPGGVVLDPFAGSGTTAIAAKVTGRKYICFEINKELYDFAVKRVKSVRVNGLGGD